MNCPNCQTYNDVNSSFCLNCGQNLQQAANQSVVTPMQQQVGANNIPFQNQQVGMNNVPFQNQTVNNSSNVEKMSIVAFFTIMLSFLLKPYTTLKEKISSFSGFKNSAIMTLIVSGSLSVINLIVTMINAVIEKKYNLYNGSYETSIVFENLKNIEYIPVLLGTIIGFIIISAAVAVVYYIGSLIIKKQANFPKLLCVASMSYIPMYISILVLIPLVSLISYKILPVVILLGTIYSFILMYEGMNYELNIEDNMKVYFNAICLSILLIILYYIGMEVLTEVITEGITGSTSVDFGSLYS